MYVAISAADIIAGIRFKSEDRRIVDHIAYSDLRLWARSWSSSSAGKYCSSLLVYCRYLPAPTLTPSLKYAILQEGRYTYFTVKDRHLNLTLRELMTAIEDEKPLLFDEARLFNRCWQAKRKLTCCQSFYRAIFYWPPRHDFATISVELKVVIGILSENYIAKLNRCVYNTAVMQHGRFYEFVRPPLTALPRHIPPNITGTAW